MSRMIDDEDDGCNTLEERKFLVHTDKYSIGEDGLIDGEIPFTDICYDLALQLQRKTKEYENAIHNWQFSEKLYSELKAEFEQLHKKYYHILNLAKQNADSSEYCMQELEAENEKLKAMAGVYSVRLMEKYKQALEDIREIAKTKFVNGLSKEADIYNVQMIKIESTINEVLD